MVKLQNFKLPIPPESVEQINLFRWAVLMSGKYPQLNLMYHVPNGGQRYKTTAKRLKAEGVKPGVPDVFLPDPRGPYHGLYIELKRTQDGRISDNQKEWIEALASQGYFVAVCYGCEEAQQVILKYLTTLPSSIPKEMR